MLNYADLLSGRGVSLCFRTSVRCQLELQAKRWPVAIALIELTVTVIYF